MRRSAGRRTASVDASGGMVPLVITGRVRRKPALQSEEPPPEHRPAPAQAPPAAAAERTYPRAGAVLVVAHVTSLVAGFLVLLYANRDQWFFGDEWEFLGHRGVLHGDRSIWAPHTDHWSTIPILIYRALFNVYGIRTYVPYVVALLLLHAAVTHLLWQAMRRVGADATVATALAAIFAIFGAGYENLLWAFQIGFVGSVALGLATVLLVNHDGGWNGRDWAGWVLSVVGLMFSGITVTMVAVAGITVLMRRNLRAAALTVAVPGAVYLVWLAAAGHQGMGAQPHGIDDVFAYPDYIWTGLRSAVEQTVGFPGSGPLLVLGLAAWLLRRGDLASGPAAPAFAGALGVIVMFSVIAVGRTALGVQQSEASRYAYIAIALALPAMALALSQLSNGLGPRQAVICFLLLLVLIHNGGVLRDQSRKQDELEQALKGRILAAAQLVSSSAIILNEHPEPQYDPDIVVSDLRRMASQGRLPASPRISDADRLAAEAVLQYTAGTTPPAVLPARPQDDGVVGAAESRDPSGCIVLTPTAPTTDLHLTVPGPFTVKVTTEASGDLTGFLRVFAPVLLTSEARTDKIEAGIPLYVSVSAAVDQVILRFPPSGGATICGVSPPAAAAGGRP
jgi:hypothetical protein